MIRVLACALAGLLATAGPAAAQIVPFDLTGLGGTGLLASNEPGGTVGTVGSGGEVGAGITFDTLTNILSVNVQWGSANGFTNLSGNATLGHIHGPTPSPAPASFGQSVGIRYFIDALPGWNPSASAGGFIGNVSILPGDVAGLFEGRFYINVHTATNGAGEIRGSLVPVPEPGSLALAGLAVTGLAARRLRRKG